MNLVKKFAVLIIVLTLGMPNVYADGNDDPRPITLTEHPINDPTKPKAPSRVRISAYYDGNSIVVTSTVAVMADVVIADASSGACLFSGQTALAPDFSCQVPAISGSSLKIVVTVGATVYEGTIYIN